MTYRVLWTILTIVPYGIKPAKAEMEEQAEQMRKKIIDTIVKEYRDYKGIDEIKRGLRIALSVSGINFTERNFGELLGEIIYELAPNKVGINGI